MKRQLRAILTSLVLLCLHGWAAAEVSLATAEALTRKSGAWTELGDMVTQVKAGLAQSSLRTKLASDELKRLEQVADEAFAPQRLRESFVTGLSRKISVAQSADALKWYNSLVGMKISALEEAASADFSDTNAAMAEGNQVLAKASAKRQLLLTQTIKASRAAEGAVTMQINSTVAVVQGVANVMPEQAAVPAGELRKLMEAERPHMLAATMGLLMSMFASTYQSASDRELEQYVRFLSSKSGAALSAAMMEALDESLSGAAQVLGRGIIKGGSATTL